MLRLVKRFRLSLRLFFEKFSNYIQLISLRTVVLKHQLLRKTVTYYFFCYL